MRERETAQRVEDSGAMREPDMTEHNGVKRNEEQDQRHEEHLDEKHAEDEQSAARGSTPRMSKVRSSAEGWHGGVRP